jgi:gamma-D-glutamyl-L-lysine dipeptidyl-peptidase
MTSLLALALWSTVLRPVANLYSQPSADAEVASQAVYGSNVERLEESSQWIKVRTTDHYTGWVLKSELLPRSVPYAAAGSVAEVSSLFANLYREPSMTSHAPLLTVAFETRLEVVSNPDQGRWIKVRLVDGTGAWVQREDVQFASRPLSINETITLAKRFLGLPYLWGGVSSFGFDCSGFTQMLCRHRGVLLPRDARVQAAWDGMTPVGRGALQPGDLLYFGPSSHKITHAGVYLGEGEMIHATSPYIQISRVEDETRKRGFMTARRLK